MAYNGPTVEHYSPIEYDTKNSSIQIRTATHTVQRTMGRVHTIVAWCVHPIDKLELIVGPIVLLVGNDLK